MGSVVPITMLSIDVDRSFTAAGIAPVPPDEPRKWLPTRNAA
jgi:hypothetical protein